nr:hypothetical protein BaRGS_001307 [Batillaria attramentaria]
MHAAGDKIRIVESGLPEPQGKTLLQKRSWLMNHADQYQKFLNFETRGQPDMTCALLVTPDLPEADVGVIYCDRDQYAVEKKLVQPASPETRVVIQCPSGLVTTHVQYQNGRTGQSRFQNVPCYVFARDASVEVPDFGKVVFDIAFGGSFFAILPAQRAGLNLTKSGTDKIQDTAQTFLKVLRSSVKLHHPDSDDLAAFLGIIFTDTDNDNKEKADLTCVEVAIFGERELARGPCGSGVTALIALHHHTGVLSLGQTRQYRNAVLGTEYTGSVVREVQVEGAGPDGTSVPGVIPEVAGRVFFTGSSTFTVEADDPVAAGYLPYRDAMSA